MTAHNNPLPALGEVEFAALEHLWRTRESDVQTAHTAFGRQRGITLNTVGSAFERLFKKGLIQRHKVSHAYRYTPKITREEFFTKRMLAAAGGVRALSRAGVLAAFVDLVAEIDEQALDRLEALVAQKREGRLK